MRQDRGWRPRPGATNRPPRQDRAPGLFYNAVFVSAADREEVLAWMKTIHPIWEDRYSARTLPQGQENRRLLRPVYWLGVWQFACLDYYHPPNGVADRCVRAEPYPPVLAKMVARIEEQARRMFHGTDMPQGWKLNCCLINLYGDQLSDEGKRDTARVGDHRDYEPGPIGSISLGERALFQFTERSGGRPRPGERRDEQVVSQQWLDDGSMLIFGGELLKVRCNHRVQRVDRRDRVAFDLGVRGFETRRINFTFRFVPEEHVVPFAGLAAPAREDVRGYVEILARHSPFFAEELAKSSTT